MNNQQSQKFIQMTTEPVGRLICKLSVPTIISMTIMAAYNMADTFFVGMLKSNSATGAIGVVFSLMTLMQAIAFFFGQGSGSSLSMELGKKNTQRAANMAATGFSLAFLTGVILLILGELFVTPLAYLLGSTDTILPYATEYLRYILLGSPFIISSYVLNNQLRFQGSATYGMIGMVSGAVLNVILDPIMIFTFDKGVSGAALATILSQFVSFCVLLFGASRAGNLPIRIANIRFEYSYFQQIVKGGLPSLCRQGLMSIAAIVLNNTAGVYGDVAIAAMSVVQRIMMLANSVLIGFGQGFQPVCGFNHGAGLDGRVKKGYWFCVLWATVFLTFASILGFLFAPELIALFRDDPDVIEFGTLAMRIQCCTFPITGFIMISSMLTQVLQKVIRASILAVVRQGLFFIPAVIILSALFDQLGIQMSQSVSDILSFLVTLPLTIRTLHELGSAMELPKS